MKNYTNKVYLYCDFCNKLFLLLRWRYNQRIKAGAKNFYHNKQCLLQANNHKIKKFAGVVNRFWSRVSIILDKSSCWEWSAGKSYVKCSGINYGRFCYKGRDKNTHVVSRIILFGEVPKGYIVCHKCDNPPCVRPSHLFLGTHLNNMKDMINKGRQLLGEELNHKLTDDQSWYIMNSKEPTVILAEIFNISKSYVHKLRKGKARKSLLALEKFPSQYEDQSSASKTKRTRTERISKVSNLS